jgi:hypothetical protein
MMTVDGSFTWVTAGQWDRMRTGFREGLGLGPFRGVMRSGERAPAALAGRENHRNVVIGPVRRHDGGATADLVADTAHPFLFDHPLDHAPGNLLIEAARQTAVALLAPHPPRLSAVSSTFDRFVELDRAAECAAEIGASDPALVRCTIRQCGGVAARIDLVFGDPIEAR